ncbi:MAG: FtsX-like permease family protein [Thermodesulfobacteriota bacterium]
MILASLLRHLSLRHLRLQKIQLAMTVAGIGLGVAAMVAIDLVSRSVLASFETSINEITGRAALQITGPEAGFPGALLEEVQAVPGVEHAVPVVEANAQLAGGRSRSLLILGVDILQDQGIRDYRLAGEAAEVPDPLLFLAKRDSILVTAAMAAQEGIALDQAVAVQTVAGIRTFTVRGLLHPEGPARVAGGDVAIMDIDAAQLAFGKSGRLDRIDVSLLPGIGLDAMKERLLARLPAGYTVDTPASRSRQVEILLARFQKSMELVSFMALFVGMYLIYNAVSIAVVQRRREIGILRALGATRAGIAGLFLAETLVAAAVASALGIGLGVLLARASVGVVAQSITEIYLKTAVSELVFSWPSAAGTAAIGMAASLLAALFPALAGGRANPVAAIRAMPYAEDAVVTGRGIPVASGLLLLGALLTLTVFLMAPAGSCFRGMGAIFLAVLALLMGLSLGTPLLLARLLPWSHPALAACFGSGGRLAGLNLQRSVRRSAVAVAAILCSIALFVSSANAVHSLRRSMFDWFDSIVRADILVSSGHPLATGGSPTIPMPAEMQAAMATVPGVGSVEPFRKGYLSYQGKKILLKVFDVAVRMEYCPGMIVQGSREDMARLLPDQDVTVHQLPW